ncbi:MAG TPA: deoxyribodipyrimidine photo-lyase, partial [Porticoccaceae bacterium]|nr:deoxyribodipyrimidine photo-lyase [Porticoccaceae bacterium]
GWQWCASTGTDAAPYFRIFNPITQSQRFDPKGEFIRRWLPQLQALDNKQIHEPWKHAVVDYPDPIVDHKAARLRALEFYKG